MKKIILLFLITFSISVFSQQNTDSIPKIKLFKQPYNGKNGAVAWSGIAAVAMVIGGGCQFAATNPKMPFPKQFGNTRVFNEQFIASEKGQQVLHFAFGFGVGVAGFSVLMATYDFGYYIKNVKNTKHTSLNFKASPSAIGLCLNFK